MGKVNGRGIFRARQALNYRFNCTSSWSISSAVVITVDAEENARWVIIMLENSRAISTVDCSNDRGEISPTPPLPALFKKKPPSSLTPATAWPAGKPAFTPLSAYPEWDSNDKKGSFMKICDMLIAEVRHAAGSLSSVAASRIGIQTAIEAPCCTGLITPPRRCWRSCRRCTRCRRTR